jgi:hypothetical protein
MRRGPRLRFWERVEWHPDAAAEAVDADQGYERAKEFNILLGR